MREKNRTFAEYKNLKAKRNTDENEKYHIIWHNLIYYIMYFQKTDSIG